MLLNETKTILDLCGGTGAWSKPYADAGYEVHVITLPQDVRLYKPTKQCTMVYVAAPPCTHFGRQWCKVVEGKRRICTNKGHVNSRCLYESHPVIGACILVPGESSGKIETLSW